MVIDFLMDYVGWPLTELELAADRAGVAVKVCKEIDDKRVKYFSIKREKGDVIVEIEDGKIAWLEVVI